MRKFIEPRRRTLFVRLGAIAALATLATIAAFAANASAGAQPAPVAKPAAATAAATVGKPNDLVVSYLAAWNERDARRRHELIAATWTDGGTYVDAHRHGEGHDGIDAMIKVVQDKYASPSAYAFRLISGIEAHHAYVRFTWAAGGMAGAPLYFEGTDIFLLASDGKVQQVIGFTNAAPAPSH